MTSLGPRAVGRWPSAALVSGCSSALVRWSSCALVRWSSCALVRWSSCALARWSSSALVRCVLLIAALVAAGPWAAAASAPADAYATARQAGEPQVQALLKPGVVRLGERAQLVISIDGVSLAELGPLPEIDGLLLQLAAGPSRQIYSTTVGGRRRTQAVVSWQLIATPQREGKFEIPPLAILVDGGEFRTEARTLEAVRDLRGEELGVLRLEPDAVSAVEGQPIGLDVLFGCDVGLGQAINYFDLRLPWIDGLPGVVVEVRPPDPRSETTRTVLNQSRVVDAEVAGQARVGERTMQLFRVRLSLTPTRAGTVELDGGLLQFAETRVRRSFFEERREIVEQFFTGSADLSLEVRALPEEGQPLDFGGAIGELELRASADVRDVRVGDSIKLTLDVTGPGNLEYFEAPLPELQEAFQGWRSYGFTEERSPDRRRIVYDLVPVSPDVERVPPIELPYFDPVAWEYRRQASDPIEIRVRPLADASGAEEQPEFERDIRDLVPEPLAIGGPEASAPSGATVLSAALGLLLGWGALRTAARQGGRQPGSVLERRRRQALRHLQRELRSSLDAESDLRAWSGFLASRTAEEPNAWVGRDVRRWAKTEPHAAELSESSLKALERVGRGVEAAYYGSSARVRREELEASAAELMEDGL